METRLRRWGHSLALRIPKALAVEAGLEDDARVEVSLENGKLVLTPLPEARWTLEELLAQVTDENLHAEVDTGPAVGAEVW